MWSITRLHPPTRPGFVTFGTRRCVTHHLNMHGSCYTKGTNRLPIACFREASLLGALMQRLRWKRQVTSFEPVSYLSIGSGLGILVVSFGEPRGDDLEAKSLAA